MAVQTTSSARSARKTSVRKQAPAQVGAMIDPERRRALIAEAAYLRAKQRGFMPGHEVEDWLAAEAEIDTALAATATKGVARKGVQ